MLKVMKECTSWLNWKNAGIAALVIGGIVICTGLPSLSVLAGVAPLLLLVACLVPCIAPLVLLRRKNRNLDTIPLTEQRGQVANSCGCGQDSCSTADTPNSCQAEQKAAKSARP
jgi:hypothetical protein